MIIDTDLLIALTLGCTDVLGIKSGDSLIIQQNLTQEEKRHVFKQLTNALTPEGRACVVTSNGIYYKKLDDKC